MTDKEDKQDISEISDQIQIKFNLNLNKFNKICTKKIDIFLSAPTDKNDMSEISGDFGR